MSDVDDAGARVRGGSGACRALTLADVRAALNGVALWCPDDSPAVTGIVAADLMSDVLVDARPGHVLVTGLVNVQVIRTAAIADLAAVVFVHGKPVSADVVDLARQMKVPVFASHETLFEAAGRLYAIVGHGTPAPGTRSPA